MDFRQCPMQLGQSVATLLGLEDIGAASDFAGDEFAARGLGIGAGHRSHCHLEPPRQVPLRRQLGADRQAPARDVFGQGVGNRQIARAGAVFERRSPN